jgi:hypothetical protein
MRPGRSPSSSGVPPSRSSDFRTSRGCHGVSHVNVDSISRRAALPWIGLTAALITPSSAFALKHADTELISSASGITNANANGPSGSPSLSADGRFVAFASTATNLDPADTTADADIYLRDLESATTVLVSRASGADGAKGDAQSLDPAISADGRFVAFTSQASNLGPTAPGSGSQVFVRDLWTHETTLVSRASGPDGAPADALSQHPSVSADGRIVAFASAGKNLHSLPGGGSGLEVYARDLSNGTTSLVSRADGPDGSPAADASIHPAVSADGTRVAFISFSGILGPGGGSKALLYVRDLAASTTTLVSRASGRNGKPVETDIASKSISADGTRIPFVASRSALDTGPPDSGSDAFLRTLETGRTSLISRGFGKVQSTGRRETAFASISGNGRFVSFALGQPRLGRITGRRPQGLYLRDLKKRATKRVVGSPRAGTPESLYSVLSRDGRVIAFQSDSKILDPNDPSGNTSVFVVRLGE